MMVDLTDTTLTIDFIRTYDYPDLYPDWNGLKLFETGVTTASFSATLAFSTLHGFAQYAADRIWINGNSLFVDFGGLYATNGNSVVLTLSAVPGPAPGILMAVGGVRL